jgi:hypothetical protein
MRMKKCSATEGLPVTRAKAVTYLILNLLATPGLGTWMAGSKLVGALQMAVAGAGFCGIVAWFGFLGANLIRQFQGHSPRAGHGWLGWGGALLFGVAWCWSLITSLLLLRASKKE